MTSASTRPNVHQRLRELIPELAKFGVVGGIGAIIDLGGAAALHGVYHVGPLKAKAISIAAATLFTYLGSRFWTFRHRANQPVLREGALFIVLNAVGLLIAELVIAGITYGLGLKGPLAYNAASVAGTGLGTIFRYFAYKKWVFLAPAAEHVPAGLAEELAAQRVAPPWEQPGAGEQPEPWEQAETMYAPGAQNGSGNGYEPRPPQQPTVESPRIGRPYAAQAYNGQPYDAQPRNAQSHNGQPRSAGRHRKPRSVS